MGLSTQSLHPEFLAILGSRLNEGDVLKKLEQYKQKTEAHLSTHPPINKNRPSGLNKNLHADVVSFLNQQAKALSQTQSYLNLDKESQKVLCQHIAHELMRTMPERVNHSEDVLVIKIGLYLRLYCLIGAIKNGRK
jgi:hypothetical protein